jgi:glycosyltransferase involved in cell wall biosynthesis
MAVHQAGIPAVIYMDTCGLVSRLGNRKGWWRHAWRPSWAKSGNIALRIYSLTKFFIDSALLITPRRRLRHLACGHAITLPTRSGVIWMKREVSLLGRPDLADKIHYSPHPQKELFRYDGTHKENVVLCVARFLQEDWPQKRPALLIQSLNAFLAKNHDWRAVVVGRGASTLANNLGLHAHAAIRFEENLAHRDLVGLYQKAKIGFWTSLWEGQQGTAAQSLCCGCSVVAPSSPLNSCFEDYVSQSSGRLATDSSITCLTEALALEAQEWAQGFRLPDKISLFWSGLLHGRQRASAILKLLDIPLPENP